MAGVLFQIVGSQYDDQTDHVWIIKSMLCDERNHEFNKIYQEIRQQHLSGKTTFRCVGNLLMQMGQYDGAEQFYRRCLHSMSSQNRRNTTDVHLDLSVVAEAKGDHKLAESLTEMAIDILVNSASDLAKPNLEIVSNIRDSLGNTAKRLNSETFIDMFQSSVAEKLNTIGRYHLETASKYKLLSHFFRVERKFDAALNNANECLEIELELLSGNHPQLATTYETIGDLHLLKGDFGSALLSYEKALMICSKSLPYNHADIASLYRRMGLIHEEWSENLDLALENYHTAMEIYLKTYSSMHRHIQELEDTIRMAEEKRKSANSDQ